MAIRISQDEQPSPKHAMDQKLLSHAAVIDMSKKSKFHSFTSPPPTIPLVDSSHSTISERHLQHNVDSAVNTLTAKLYAFDKANVDNPKYTSLCNKAKAHNMTYLMEDIRRFGPALNFETEKGKQFNKHIREHLIHTNWLNTSRDV
ncbi:hypothetical protein PHYBLDRAFT_138712 [Phycomyces blakesleeanus NRRL 1555(-)]|uniref:Uncharacterized protein n=1 Tax=Phycomyces blakesleeanus (strain ATCC 8743b / DSM 1359 / FGSC 10004 / NBRC 33097 / NRRL 1555) TaxID=763407 RepID=A0A163ES04_PHYB8|nr:hypothetical protein PHYBLDRAFT_138712 [Phycomyces blakesleeanus NRRL 1555(-)]OAD81170.1 hypothetical protein PHYBLDRAFT_138712 [Phycomyces blakesleeanus NRRL 1555(-)]|eukprot:XP_018299210.1 hypothetical protein PHYBLDRAFT_138712 [Phycomyces blakesleeanus NRRL 1555(-)]